MADSVSIDGFGPIAIHRPANRADACELVKAQAAKAEAVYPVGGRTQLDFGLVPSKPGIALDTTALACVIDYPAKDMTITVEAGMTLAALQEILARENQWLPLDAPDPAKQTLGGLVATDTAGPRRLGYGTLRDFVIGIRFINDAGQEIQGGGRVVKNVAGYDLMKLHTGALGAFGVITQLTLKVRPKPEKKAILAFTNPPSTPWNVLFDKLHASSSRPVAVRVDSWGADGNGQALFEEKSVTVAAQVRAIQDDLKTVLLPEAVTSVPDSLTEAQVDQIVQGLTASPMHDRHSFIVRMSVKPSQVPEVLMALETDSVCHSDPLNGIVLCCAKTPIKLPAIGSKVVLRAPPAWKTPERVFGPVTPAWTLMTHIKRTLDPGDVFNPGRMFIL